MECFVVTGCIIFHFKAKGTFVYNTGNKKHNLGTDIRQYNVITYNYSYFAANPHALRAGAYSLIDKHPAEKGYSSQDWMYQ